ncbi:hypothetical protein BMAA0655 [Burkholderia mallei ATCC 23344]|uniref:Uncharacterized protein n=1 Tax=Burkholderia mallei (strain ATCC 23344) TaxID=243160 RepID=A0A0H2XD79_BURMA|nr:hypothetical protein BMAA0655 [Burkholderia mallei ATCC 23344]
MILICAFGRALSGFVDDVGNCSIWDRAGIHFEYY